MLVSGISLRPEINPCVDFQRCIYSKSDLAWKTELLKLEMSLDQRQNAGKCHSLKDQMCRHPGYLSN